MDGLMKNKSIHINRQVGEELLAYWGELDLWKS